jgi:hypothetical protein
VETIVRCWIILAFAFLSLSAIGGSAAAAPVCGLWQFVKAGVEDRVCVSDNGTRYCERRLRKDDKTIKSVSCEG